MVPSPQGSGAARKGLDLHSPEWSLSASAHHCESCDPYNSLARRCTLAPQAAGMPSCSAGGLDVDQQQMPLPMHALAAITIAKPAAAWSHDWEWEFPRFQSPAAAAAAAERRPRLACSSGRRRARWCRQGGTERQGVNEMKSLGQRSAAQMGVISWFVGMGGESHGFLWGLFLAFGMCCAVPPTFCCFFPALPLRSLFPPARA